MLCRWYVRILLYTSFAEMSLVGSEKESSYCRKLWEAIEAHMDFAEGDPELQFLFFDKP